MMLKPQPQSPRWCPRCRGMVAWVRQTLVNGRWCEFCHALTKPHAPKPIKCGGRPRRRSKSPRTRQIARMDALWSRIVRRHGRCDLYGQWCACGGPIQGAHGFPKGVYPATRHLLINGFAICAGHHRFAHQRHAHWVAFMLEQLGPEAYQELNRIAVENKPQDLDAIEATLREEASRLGVE
jgi:hypothetical protein